MSMNTGLYDLLGQTVFFARWEEGKLTVYTGTLTKVTYDHHGKVQGYVGDWWRDGELIADTPEGAVRLIWDSWNVQWNKFTAQAAGMVANPESIKPVTAQDDYDPFSSDEPDDDEGISDDSQENPS